MFQKTVKSVEKKWFLGVKQKKKKKKEKRCKERRNAHKYKKQNLDACLVNRNHAGCLGPRVLTLRQDSQQKSATTKPAAFQFSPIPQF